MHAVNNFFKRNRNPEIEAMKRIGGDFTQINALKSLGKLASTRNTEIAKYEEIEPWVGADIIQVDFGTGERIIPVEPVSVEEVSKNFQILKPRPGRSDDQTAG